MVALPAYTSDRLSSGASSCSLASSGRFPFSSPDEDLGYGLLFFYEDEQVRPSLSLLDLCSTWLYRNLTRHLILDRPLTYCLSSTEPSMHPPAQLGSLCMHSLPADVIRSEVGLRTWPSSAIVPSREALCARRFHSPFPLAAPTLRLPDDRHLSCCYCRMCHTLAFCSQQPIRTGIDEHADHS